MATENKSQDTAPKFGINAQYVKDFSLENPNAPAIFAQAITNPEVDVDIDVGARKLSDDIYEVALALKATANMGTMKAFVIELVYAGVFTIAGIKPENLEPMLLIECPRLLFPFARAAVANLTREGGFPPLLVNPVDFAALYKQQKDRLSSQVKLDADTDKKAKKEA